MKQYKIYESLDDSDITDLQKLWWTEYWKCNLNATKAAEKAGYEDPQQSGWENLQHFKKMRKEWAENQLMLAEEALLKINEQANANVNDVMNDLENKGHLVVAISQNPMGGSSIQLNSQQAALQIVLKAHGAFDKKQEAGNSASLDSWLEQIKEAKEKYGPK